MKNFDYSFLGIRDSETCVLLFLLYCFASIPSTSGCYIRVFCPICHLQIQSQSIAVAAVPPCRLGSHAGHSLLESGLRLTCPIMEATVGTSSSSADAAVAIWTAIQQGMHACHPPVKSSRWAGWCQWTEHETLLQSKIRVRLHSNRDSGAGSQTFLCTGIYQVYTRYKIN